MSLPLLVRVALVLAAGIVMGLLRGDVLAPAWPLLLGGTALLVAWGVLGGRGFLGAALLAGLALGAGAHAREAGSCGNLFRDGERIALSGVLQGLPLDGASVELRVLDGCEGTVRIRWRETPDHAAGATLEVAGRWWAFPAPRTWPRRAERAGVLTVEGSREVAAPSHPVLRLRGSAQRRARLLFGERSGAVEALILARRGGIAADVRDRFARAGLMHLLAISGLHVGLVAGALTLLGGLLRVPPRTTAIAAACATVAYVLFIGAPHAAARAGLQVLLLLLSRILQRPALPSGLLAAAAIPLMARDPFAVLDPGFQLSFAGVAGIVALRRRLLDGWLPPGPAYLRDSLATSVAATIATSPIAALHFGLVSPLGVVANIAAVPLAGVAVPGISVALIASVVSVELGRFLAGGAALLLAAIEWVATITAAVPYGHAFVPPSAVLGWGVAAFAFGVAHRSLARRRIRPVVRRALVAASACAVLIAWPLAAARFGDGALEVHAIDVGQGDALAIRTPRGRWILVDAGPRTPRFDAGEARVVPYLQRRGARRVEWVILTHPHMDHVGGARAVLARLGASALIDPAVPGGSRSYVDLLGAARAHGTLWLAAAAGRELHLDGVVLRLLYPDGGVLDAGWDENHLSVVLRLEFGHFAALFMGDAPAAVEEAVIGSLGAEARTDLLKVGHHGSNTSTSEALLAATSPSVALVSLGRANRYGHPHPAVVERLERHGVDLFRTDQHGWVRVSARADGSYRVRTERVAAGR